uniref:Transcription initiation factor TFIID subunit 8 n=1 Tax=Anthurium amnicola TaxID=1678845 RepID=A0A1D1XYH9_9ARAE
MSDGGGKETGRDTESSSRGGGSSAGDDFGRAISRIAVAQICESLGFHSIQHSALDALSDVVIRYICDLGRTSHFYANLAGRTCCSVFDILQGLEDLVSSQGFTGASDLHRCLVSSGVVREITQYVSTADEVPFARPVPHFPMIREPKLAPSIKQCGELSPGKHIPYWLPAFPDPHTYIHTPVWDERATDPRTGKIEQARQRRKAERSLLNLQQRLASTGSASLLLPVVDDDRGKEEKGEDNNPFLAPPLPFGEKEVSPISLPEASVGKKVSVLETFAPAIEAVNSGALDSGAAKLTVLPNKRPPVHFRLGMGKKSTAASLSLNALGARKTALRIFKDGEKDDKKRRAEMILREAMENPQELTQL